jgi:hypothetical protein
VNGFEKYITKNKVNELLLDKNYNELQKTIVNKYEYIDDIEIASIDKNSK